MTKNLPNQIAGARRRLENLIQKQFTINPNVGVSAARHSRFMLGALHDRLVDDIIFNKRTTK